MGLLDRFFGGAKAKPNAPTGMTPEEAEKILQAYGHALEFSAPTPGTVADARTLPHPKERIKQAIVFAIRHANNPQMREQLKVGYICLADWQDMKTWTVLVQPEHDALAAELKKLGL